MLKYRRAGIAKNGFLGTVLVLLVIVVGLNPERLESWAGDVRYRALFVEAGGLANGGDVTLSGTTVGRVTDVSLVRGVAEVTMAIDSTVRLGDQTTAHIRTGTLLGERVVTLSSDGDGPLRPNAVIPVSRTSSPYSLTTAVEDFTTNTQGTDTAQLSQSVDALAVTLDRVAPQVGPTLEGLTRLSRSLNERDGNLRMLLQRAGTVTELVSERSQQVNQLILDGSQLLAVLTERRQEIVRFLAATSAVSRELTALVADNEEQLAPALERLNSVTAMLEKNRDNIAKAIPGLAKFQLTQGETVSNGFYYTANIPNLLPGQLLQPFLDYSFGFRRGTNAGQPPDNAGPRAELPWPVNGIPGGSR